MSSWKSSKERGTRERSKEMVAMASSGTAVVSLPTDTQILITREFDAPKHLVYRAYTEPELIKRWWSGERGEVTSVEVDLRVGGTWRYVMMANEGFEMPDEDPMSGTPEAEEGALNTVSFTEVDGRTTLTTVVECHTKEVRDAIIDSGMEGGMQEAMDELEQVAVSLR